MNSDIFEGQYRQLKGKLKSTFAKLTDNDLGEVEGKADVMIGKLQERYGWSKSEAKAELEKAVADGRKH